MIARSMAAECSSDDGDRANEARSGAVAMWALIGSRTTEGNNLVAATATKEEVTRSDDEGPRDGDGV
ncbi:hypothetical protein SESBI_36719 [Sesbania bispinosa]|nr:hypothetical protein SESBI_36719 [Sesbania bispinosa]